MKTNQELIAELNQIRQEPKPFFNSMSKFTAWQKSQCEKKAAILSQIEDNCNPGLTKDQIEVKANSEWKKLMSV